MSPELLDPERFGLEESRPTVESDCYSFGMVICEVLTGQVPFALWREPIVIRKVLDGERPRRPQEPQGNLITDPIWSVAQSCWKPHPSDRPSIEAVLLGLGGILSASMPTSLGVDRDAETDTDNESDAITSEFSRFSSFYLKLN